MIRKDHDRGFHMSIIGELSQKIEKDLFVLLVTTACIANMVGFLSNAFLFGMSIPTIVCGICEGIALICGVIGLVLKKRRTATILIVLIMSMFEFPFLFYVYGSGMGVYLILGIVALAVYFPKPYKIPMIIVNVLESIFVITLWNFYPIPVEPINEADLFGSVLFSYVIVAVTLAVIICRLIYQYELQHRHMVEITLQLREEKKSYDAIHEDIQSGKWSFHFDKNDHITDCNWSDVFRHMLGYCDETDFPNQIDSWSELVHPDDKEWVLHAFWSAVFDHSGEKTYDVQYRAKVKSGEYRWFRDAGKITRRNDGSAEAFYGVFIDTTDFVESKQRLQESLEKMNDMNKELQQALDNFKQADYDRRIDFLTGLHNRQDMFEMLQDSLSGKRNSITAMYMLDIDNFKMLNDHYGHTYGDECLMRIGAALSKYGEDNDMVFYRYGGEEMLGIRFLEKKPADAIAQELVQLVRDQQILRDDLPSGIVTVSLGYTTNNGRYEKMIDMADTAMYQAKQNGKNQAVCFDTM